MNRQSLLMTTALACAAGFIGTAHANDEAVGNVDVYRYGMPLHVAKVVALTEPTTVDCEVVSAHMKYIDTSGNPVEISYRKLSEACRLQN